MASFTSLPPEIRLEIYSYMAIPLTTPFITWHGLYLSNRTIRAEMDAECGKILRAYLFSKAAKMASRVQEVGRVVGARDCEKDELLLPGTFLQMQNLRIRLGTFLAVPFITAFLGEFCETYFASATMVVRPGWWCTWVTIQGQIQTAYGGKDRFLFKNLRMEYVGRDGVVLSHRTIFTGGPLRTIWR